MYVSEHSYGYGGGYGGAGTPHMQSHYDNSAVCCPGSSYHAMGQTGMPRAWRKELFVNVMVHSVDYANPVKHVSNWVSSLVRSNHTQGHIRTAEIMPDIVHMIIGAIQQHGWHSDVQPVMLPPASVHDPWAPFRKMGYNPSDELPIFMCFRVNLISKSAHGIHGGGLFSCCTGCDLFPIAAADYNHIAMIVNTGLQRLPHPVMAQVDCVDAPGACHSLMNKGIAQANMVISQSRGHSDYGGGYGGGYGAGPGVGHGYGGGYGGHGGLGGGSGYGSASGYGSPSYGGGGGGYGSPSASYSGGGGGYSSPNRSDSPSRSIHGNLNGY